MVKEKLHEAIGEYLYKYRDSNEVATHKELADIIKKFRNKNGRSGNGNVVTFEELHRYVSKAREYLELEYKCTIWNLRNLGFRVATPDELAMYTARSVRRTIMIADRTVRLTNIVDRRKMPYALQVTFKDNEQRIKTLGVRGKRFMSTFIDYLKQERVKLLEENKDEKIQINKSQVRS